METTKINSPELIITRHFDSPKEKVFNAFANAEAMGNWWGPPGFQIEVLQFEFKPGGIFHYSGIMMGQKVWAKFVYREISIPNLLEFTSSFCDENGEIIRAPFSNNFPMEILNRLEFSEANGNTTITLIGKPICATEEEAHFYTSMIMGIQQGFGATFIQLENYLANID